MILHIYILQIISEEDSETHDRYSEFQHGDRHATV